MTTTESTPRPLPQLTRKALVGLTLLILPVILVAYIVSRPAVPKFRLVAEHGSVLSIVVDEKVAADDAALLQIADSLVPRFRKPTLVLHVWTEGHMVPYEILDMTPAQLAARRARVEIDVNRDMRKVDGRR